MDMPREAAAYAMLRQVLTNHGLTHALDAVSMLTASQLLLVGICVQLGDLGVALDALVPTTRTRLGQEVRTRLAEPQLPLLPWAGRAVEDDGGTRPGAVQAVWTALTALLNDAGGERGVTVQEGWRIAIRLVADVVATLGHQEAWEPEESEAFIASVDLARLIAEYPRP